MALAYASKTLYNSFCHLQIQLYSLRLETCGHREDMVETKQHAALSLTLCVCVHYSVSVRACIYTHVHSMCASMYVLRRLTGHIIKQMPRIHIA